MTWPTVTVRIAFATAPYAAVPTWVDVSSTVQAFDINRGRQHELDRMEAGTATVQLLNTSGNYWPLNAAGTYYPNVLPGKRINIRAVYGGLTYDLFTGFIESWDHGFSGDGDHLPIVTVTAADLAAALAGLKLNDVGGYAQELSDVRVGNVLDALGWPAADRDLRTSQTTVIATGALSNVNALSHLRTVEQSEAGLLWIRGEGYAVWQGRYDRISSYGASQATYGDDPGELGYRTPVYSYDKAHIYNDVRQTRSGGTEQAIADATSQNDYGIRTLNRTGLLQTTDAEVLDQAYYMLARYKDPEFRVSQITVRPEGDPTNLWPDVLGFEISTRITVRLNAAGLDADYFVEGIRHRATMNPKVWDTTWSLSPSNAQAFWVLDSLVNSLLGSTTRPGY